MKRALVVMAKQPQAGQTKTRLCPPLTLDQAADLYAAFLCDVLASVAAVAEEVASVRACVACYPAQAQEYFARLAPEVERMTQEGADLSERLHGVLTALLEQGYAQVVAVSSDSPDLPRACLVEAFARLDDPSTDVVLGPCEDGGYYLIGVKAAPGRMVRDVRMSTPRVLADTLAIAEAESLRVHLLPMWYDVDAVEDLRRLAANTQRDPNSAPETALRLSALALGTMAW
jgi:rSAM/selenodomain-associated transferase 1